MLVATTVVCYTETKGNSFTAVIFFCYINTNLILLTLYELNFHKWIPALVLKEPPYCINIIYKVVVELEYFFACSEYVHSWKIQLCYYFIQSDNNFQFLSNIWLAYSYPWWCLLSNNQPRISHNCVIPWLIHKRTFEILNGIQSVDSC